MDDKYIIILVAIVLIFICNLCYILHLTTVDNNRVKLKQLEILEMSYKNDLNVKYKGDKK